jgi:hypothetical protein
MEICGIFISRDMLLFFNHLGPLVIKLFHPHTPPTSRIMDYRQASMLGRQFYVGAAV